MIEGARKRGMDVTTEAYPYTAGMTDIQSAIFGEGWQGKQGGSLQGPAMGRQRGSVSPPSRSPAIASRAGWW